MTHDDYAAQMQAAVERESARTAAEGNCIARTKDGDLCRRRIAKELLAKGIKHCRIHVSAPRRPPSRSPSGRARTVARPAEPPTREVAG